MPVLYYVCRVKDIDMKANEYIKALNDASSAEDVISIWQKAAKPSELSLKEIVYVHKACGHILFDAMSHISLQGKCDEEKTTR